MDVDPLNEEYSGRCTYSNGFLVNFLVLLLRELKNLSKFVDYFLSVQ